VLLALAGCETPARPDAAPPAWVYPPSLTAWPIGPVSSTIGRSQPPQLTEHLGISGTGVPLRLPTPWTVPGDGPARAAVYGLAGDRPAVELIDVDAGKVLWSDTTACAAPIVGVTDEVIVCADAKGTRGIALDGNRTWSSEAMFVAMTGERIVTAGAGETVILDAALGDELARVKLPQPAIPKQLPKGAPAPVLISVESIIASCGDAGRELFAYGQAGQLARIAEGQGGPKLVWSVTLPAIAAIDACDGASVVVTTSGAAGTSLVALSRETGKPTGTIDGVRGFWPARDGSARLEVSTDAGVALYPRDLAATPEHVPLPVLAELLAKRGDLRLVRATQHTAAVLDAAGVRAYVPLAQLGAVLGDSSIIAASWLGSPGEVVHRIALPERYRKLLRVPALRPPVTVPAELRDLPATSELDTGGAIAKPDTGKHAVATVALDPIDGRIYATTLERAPDDAAAAGVARFDLDTRTWTWSRGDGCGTGTPVALAASRELVVCAARGNKGASVIATTRDGAPLWQWRGDNVDTVTAAGDVVLVHDADRMHVLDARDGAVLAVFESDDGAALPAAALDIAGMTMVVTAQRGRVLARLPRVHMVPAWTLAVRGVVHALVPAGDGVLVVLEDGDAYRVDGRTGKVVAMPGLDLIWSASGDVVTGQAPGGSIAPASFGPAPAPIERRRPAPVRRRRAPPPRDPSEDPPVLPKPWPAPAVLAESWQYTLYELTGAARARNDYALAAPITPAPRGPGDSPFVIQFGPGLRELLVLEPRRGDPVRRVHLPDDAAPGTAFATVVAGKPVVGILLQNPLRAVLLQ
jgi:outer membrane protein assembly factor BamB